MDGSSRDGTVVPFPGARPRAGHGRPWRDAVAEELATALGEGPFPPRGPPATPSSYMARLLAAGRADAVADGPAHADLHLAVARALARGEPTAPHAAATAALVAGAMGRARAATRAMMALAGGGVPVRSLPEHAAWAVATRAEFAATALSACIRGDPAGATCATLLAAARISNGDPATVRGRALALLLALGTPAG